MMIPKAGYRVHGAAVKYQDFVFVCPIKFQSQDLDVETEKKTAVNVLPTFELSPKL